MKTYLYYLFICAGIIFTTPLCAQNDTLFYLIDFKDAGKNLFNVQLKMKARKTGVLDYKIPEWTPGYYQILHFSKNIFDFKAFVGDSTPTSSAKLDHNTWRIGIEKGETINIQYKVLAKDRFIAKPYIDEDWAFIRPTGVFIFPYCQMNLPVKLTFINNKWKEVATGLDKNSNNFIAKNIDQLFDSPILLGSLEELPFFTVKGIPHYFSGREFEDFNRMELSECLRKIVQTATDLMNDIPYRHYSFISIGRGNGGIEQTNSTALTFTGAEFKDSAGRQKILNFFTHEYFHHFNIKRIRPIELGPFDYSKENRTNLLWVGEGLTVYFEDIILNRAGLKSRSQMLSDWERMIGKYENNAGKNFQTLAESSYQTWEDGPFGIKGKTISYYEKGPLIGMLLDLKIRANTGNRSSLIDVMKKLYYKFYKNENRGFTGKEMRETCEEIAGSSLEEIFNYVFTTHEIDYNRYFNLAGLEVKKTGDSGQLHFDILFVKNPSGLQKKIFNDLFRK